MIITCPECLTSFAVPEGALGESGRKVRCASCKSQWHAMPVAEKEAPPKIAQPPADAPPAAGADESPAAGKEAFDEEADEFENDPFGQPVDADLDHIKATARGGVAEGDVDADIGRFEDSDDDGAFGEDGSGKSKKKTGGKGKRKKSVDDSESVADALAAVRDGDFDDEKIDLGGAGGGRGLVIGWVSLVVFLVGIIMALVFMQETITGAWPASTRLYEMFGAGSHARSENQEAEGAHDNLSEYIRITYQSSAEIAADGSVVLIIRGTVSNSASFDIDLPRVRGVLRNQQRRDIREWYFDFDETTIRGGRVMPFQSTVPNAPRDTDQLELFLLWGE
jgi:predicted Zn finger-like uncharacterized protein